MKNIVLIDIDGTLFDSNSTFDFLDSLPHGTWYGVYRRLSSTLLGRIVNKLSIILFHKDLVRIIGVGCLKDFSKKKLIFWGEKFYDDFLVCRKNEEIFSVLEEEKNKGNRIILVSATLDFLSEIISRRLGISEVIATELHYKNEICQGLIAKDRLGHKFEALLEFGVSFPVSLTVTDNVTDDILLSKSHRQIIVFYPKEIKRWKAIIKKYGLKNIKEIYYE